MESSGPWVPGLGLSLLLLLLPPLLSAGSFQNDVLNWRSFRHLDFGWKTIHRYLSPDWGSLHRSIRSKASKLHDCDGAFDLYLVLDAWVALPSGPLCFSRHLCHQGHWWEEGVPGVPRLCERGGEDSLGQTQEIDLCGLLIPRQKESPMHLFPGIPTSGKEKGHHKVSQWLCLSFFSLAWICKAHAWPLNNLSGRWLLDAIFSAVVRSS